VNQLLTPILAPLLQHRWMGFLLVGIGIVQTASVLVGIQIWTCPIRATLHIPCPGCGLSRATALLVQGKWGEMLHTHAFAPLFLLGFAVIAATSILPESLRQKVIGCVAALERRTGIVMILLLALIAYWGLRLIGLF
jgi:hypothetical protein